MTSRRLLVICDLWSTVCCCRFAPAFAPRLISPLHALKITIVLRVLLIILLKGADEDEGDEAAEEDHHHEGVKNGEPMDLVLEEFVVEVPLESVVEGFICRLPNDCEGEGELVPHLNGLEAIAGHVDLNDTVVVVFDGEEAFGEDVVGPVRPLPNHPPNWKVVKVHLVEVTTINGLREGVSVLEGVGLGEGGVVS